MLQSVPTVCASSAERTKGKNRRAAAIGHVSLYLSEKPANTAAQAPRETGAASLERQVLSEKANTEKGNAKIRQKVCTSGWRHCSGGAGLGAARLFGLKQELE
jgi:hypothetical protein